MKFIFRPMIAPAMKLKKFCYRLAMMLTRNGVVSRIEDGYLIRVSRTGETCIADVIETPAYFVCSRADYNLSGARPHSGFVFGDRGVLAPRVTPPTTPMPPPVVQDISNIYIYEVPGCTFIGVPPADNLSSADFFPPMCRASVVRDHICMGRQGLADYSPAYSGLQAYADFTIVSFATRPVIYAEYPLGIPTQTQPPISRLVVTDTGIQNLLGVTDVFLDASSANLAGGVTAPLGRAPACSEIITPPATPDEPGKRGIIFAQSLTFVDERNDTDQAIDISFGLFVALVNIASPTEEGTAQQAATPQWTSMQYTGKRYLGSMGIASDGAVATLVTSAMLYPPGLNQYVVEASWYGVDGLLGSSILHSVSTTGNVSEAWQVIGECGGAVALAIVEGDSDTLMTGVARFALCRQGVITQSNMHTLGWRPHTAICRGYVTPYDDSPNLTNPVMFNAVVDLGAGQIGVVACSSSDLVDQVSGNATWFLVVLDAETLAYVEVRGEIASLFFQWGIYEYAYQTVSITVVAQQVRDDSGEVTTPAVLLATVAETINDRWLLLSRDGGQSWDRIREAQPPGDTFYLGNRLHQVMIGRRL